MRDRWITDWDQSERFPYYTRANVGEVLPDPSSPLNTTLIWDESLVPGWREGYVDEIGTHRPEELSEVRAEVIGNFGGYHYINLSATRMIGRRMPGLTVETFDQAWIGDLTDVPPYVDSPGDECPECTEKAGAKMAWALTTTEFPEVEEGKRRADTASGRATRSARSSTTPRSSSGRASRCPTCATATATTSRRRRCRRWGPRSSQGTSRPSSQPTLLGRLISGLGEVDSAAPSFAMWTLSRSARSSALFSGAFDRGVATVLAELRDADDPAAVQWLDDFEQFEFDYGSRAPNEWDIRSDSWESEPRLALVAIDQMRHADDSLDPRLSLERNRADREALTASLVAQLGTEAERTSFLAASASVGRFFPWRERTKTNCVKVANEVRVAMFELGRRMVARGVIDDHHDITLLCSDELDAFVADPESFAAELRRRRVEYDELFELDPPFVLTSIPPLTEWPRREHHQAALAVSGDVLTGVAGSPGRARGAVRVVHDPFDPGELRARRHPGRAADRPGLDAAVRRGGCGRGGRRRRDHPRGHRQPGARDPVRGVGHYATSRLADGADVEVDGDAGTVTIL